MVRLMDVFRAPRHLWTSARAPVGSLLDKLRVARLRWQLTRLSSAAIAGHDDTTTELYLHRAGFSPGMIDGFFRAFYGGVFLERELRTSSRMFEFTFKMFSEGYATLPAQGMASIPGHLAARLPAAQSASAQRSSGSRPGPSPFRRASESQARPWSWRRMRPPLPG